MEPWRRVWRTAVAPLLTVAQLQRIRRALAEDDPRLIQGATTTPPPLQSVQDWPCEAGCLLAYAAVEDFGGWGTATVGEVEEFFARMCFEIDITLGEPAGCWWLLNYFDETERGEMRRELLAEVDRWLAFLADAEAIVQQVADRLGKIAKGEVDGAQSEVSGVQDADPSWHVGPSSTPQ